MCSSFGAFLFRLHPSTERQTRSRYVRIFHPFATSPVFSFICRFEYLFNFDSMFEIHDDIEVLKRMGMACGLEVGKCSPEDLKVARSLVPKALEPYVIGKCHMLILDTT